MNTQISKFGRPAAMLMAMTMVLVPAPSASAITVADCPPFPMSVCSLAGSIGIGDICHENPLSDLAIVDTSPVCPTSGATSRVVFTLEHYKDGVLEEVAYEQEGTMRVIVQVVSDSQEATFKISHANGGPAREVRAGVWELPFPASKNHADFTLELLAVSPDGAAPSVALKVLPDEQPEAEYFPHVTNSQTLISFG